MLCALQGGGATHPQSMHGAHSYGVMGESQYNMSVPIAKGWSGCAVLCKTVAETQTKPWLWGPSYQAQLTYPLDSFFPPPPPTSHPHSYITPPPPHLALTPPPKKGVVLSITLCCLNQLSGMRRVRGLYSGSSGRLLALSRILYDIQHSAAQHNSCILKNHVLVSA